jgi:hypothetical protein
VNEVVLIGENLSNTFLIRNGLKQGDVLSPLLFNVALEYAIRKVRENRVGLKLSGSHRMLVYAGDLDLLGDNINTITKSTKDLIDALQKTNLEGSREREREKYVDLSLPDFGAKS